MTQRFVICCFDARPRPHHHLSAFKRAALRLDAFGGGHLGGTGRRGIEEAIRAQQIVYQIDDDRRCAQKYKMLWTDYVKRVPYRIVPGVY